VTVNRFNKPEACGIPYEHLHGWFGAMEDCYSHHSENHLCSRLTDSFSKLYAERKPHLRDRVGIFF
jgi:hypothetical protein